MRRRLLSLVIILALLAGFLPLIATSASASEAWLWPLDGCYIVLSNFGYRDLNGDGALDYSDPHRGIDIIRTPQDSTKGMPIRAAKSGTIITRVNTCPHVDYKDNCGCNGGAGNYIVIQHTDGTYSRYLHMLQEGMHAEGYVSQGETIGYVGTSGWSYGYHLHFEIYDSNWGLLNPMPTNSEISIWHEYSKPSDWPSEWTTYVFESGVPLTPKMWFENPKMTDTIIQGKSYVPECTVCSNNGVKWYAVVIEDSSGNYLQVEGEDVWKVASTNRYPITEAAKRLDFASLAEGNYRFSVQCMDNDDNYYTIYDKNFTVSKPSMWFENVNMTSFILQGTGYPLECTVCGNNGVKWYALVIYDSENNVVQNESEAVWEHASVDTNSYPITNMLRFADLSVGNYRLSIQCMDNDDNYFTIYEKDFVVGAPDMWCENINMPDEITVGHSFNLSGSIRGNNLVKWYAIVIYDNAGNALQTKTEAVWQITDTYTYPITAAAEQLDFSVLPK